MSVDLILLVLLHVNYITKYSARLQVPTSTAFTSSSDMV